MPLKSRLLAIVLCGALSSALHAREPEAPSFPEPRQLLGGLVSEDDVARLFEHLRESMRATAEGREPPPMPEALARRLEAAGGELRLRGLDAAMLLTRFVEQAVRGAVRELAPPPSSSNPN